MEFWILSMKIPIELTAALAMMCLASSCGRQSPEGQFVRQKIPVEIRHGVPVRIEISALSGNGVNEVGIRCAPQVWNVLNSGTKAIEVQLKASDKPNTTIGGIDPASSGTAFFGYLPNAHYLFYITGEFHAKASVEISFLNAPLGTTRAEIIICNTPADTGP
jgi:hypothetical protein